MNESSLFVILRDKVAGDTCPNVGVYRAIQRSDPFSDQRHILLDNFCDKHFLRAEIARFRTGLRAPGKKQCKSIAKQQRQESKASHFVPNRSGYQEHGAFLPLRGGDQNPQVRRYADMSPSPNDGLLLWNLSID